MNEDDDDFYDSLPDDMPTPCPECHRIVDFNDMVSAANGRDLICKQCQLTTRPD